MIYTASPSALPLVRDHLLAEADTFKSYGKPLEDEALAICYLNRRTECFQEL